MPTPRRGGARPLSDVAEDLGLPLGFGARPEVISPAVSSALEWLVLNRPPKQNFWPALTLAIICQVELLLELEGRSSLEDIFASHPPEVGAEGGRAVNTLNFTRAGGDSVKLRPFYNEVANIIRNVMLRQHPSSAAHATQSWNAYRPLIGQIGAFLPGERRAFAEGVWKLGVLDKPERVIATVKERTIRPFEYVLSEMSTQVQGIRGGALMQALAYGYLRADSPNLILESHNVNTPSSPAGMLGDVDGFRGSEPELACEVKDVDIDEDNAENLLSDFFEDIFHAPNATAVVICRSCTVAGKEYIEARNVTVLDREELIRRVGVWDLPKQQEALRGVEYYLGRIQRENFAVDYLRQWLATAGVDGGLGTARAVLPHAAEADTGA